MGSWHRDADHVAEASDPRAIAEVGLLICDCRGAADTEDEAHKRADVLVDAGVVLRFNGVVYLRPQEVSELVYRVGCHTEPCAPSSPATTV